MSETRRWRDTSHLDRAIDTAGGRDAFDAAIAQMLHEAHGVRLADVRNYAVAPRTTWLRG